MSMALAFIVSAKPMARLRFCTENDFGSLGNALLSGVPLGQVKKVKSASGAMKRIADLSITRLCLIDEACTPRAPNSSTKPFSLST